ncbi:synaptotagmin-16 isoform X2 [Agrilus planipennis]|uniref:Synaptotagmin-16 isoform X2 n=1 Tax=Agrilus planipennis TaxID=224129 RepID=A0A1W4XHW4_AGRPL|nr:synaptotagmin-16 isoform X2 [Agrilus planipennis]
MGIQVSSSRRIYLLHRSQNSQIRSIRRKVSFKTGTALFGVVAGFGSLMLVFLLYINKRWWFNNVGGMSCCNDICPPVSSRPASSTSLPSSILPRSKQKLIKTFSFDVGDSSSESEVGGSNEAQQQKPCSSTASTNPKDVYYPPRSAQDLSLAEKGKAGITSNSSCCSSTTSSVGEKHSTNTNTISAFSKTVVSEQMNDSIRPFEFSESKIDNQNLEYQQEQQTNCKSAKINIHDSEDCILVMNPSEADLESGDLLSNLESDRLEPQTFQISRCGQLEIALQYDAPMRKMTVHVLQARDIPSRDRGQPTHTQVRLILLPSKKQKHKTKIRSGENPQYLESFLLHRVNPEDVNSMGLRLRLYGCERMRRERLIGEAIVSFANINLEFENNLWLNLEPRANLALNGCTTDMMSLSRSDSTGSTHSMQHGGVPELLLGLSYNATTGRLSVEIVKGSHFRNLALNRAPDTYVKLHLVSSTGQQLGYSKTTVRRGQPNPLFKETFIFQVALFQLADVTLMVSVYNRKGVTKKKEMVGWFSLGLNSSGAEELAHWMDMKEFQQEQICRWHVLIHS